MLQKWFLVYFLQASIFSIKKLNSLESVFYQMFKVMHKKWWFRT